MDVEWSLSWNAAPRLRGLIEDGSFWHDDDYPVMSVGQGWWPLVEDCHNRLVKACDGEPYCLYRINQRFGYLDYWAVRPEGASDAVGEKMSTIIAETESVACSTCEACGAPGRHRHRQNNPDTPRVDGLAIEGRGLAVVLCDACDVYYPDPPWAEHIAETNNHVERMQQAGYSDIQIYQYLCGKTRIGPPEGRDT